MLDGALAGVRDLVRGQRVGHVAVDLLAQLAGLVDRRQVGLAGQVGLDLDEVDPLLDE